MIQISSEHDFPDTPSAPPPPAPGERLILPPGVHLGQQATASPGAKPSGSRGEAGGVIPKLHDEETKFKVCPAGHQYHPSRSTCLRCGFDQSPAEWPDASAAKTSSTDGSPVYGSASGQMTPGLTNRRTPSTSSWRGRIDAEMRSLPRDVDALRSVLFGQRTWAWAWMLAGILAVIAVVVGFVATRETDPDLSQGAIPPVAEQDGGGGSDAVMAAFDATFNPSAECPQLLLNGSMYGRDAALDGAIAVTELHLGLSLNASQRQYVRETVGFACWGE